MRVAATMGLSVAAIGTFVHGASLGSLALGVASLAAGLLLLLGLWTPVAGVLATLVVGLHGIAHASAAGVDILVGVLGLALALLGPGAWSMDARLFGWKRFEIRNGGANGNGAGSSSQDSPPV
jgi:hypothetical protein